jgi:hypothetical protein
MTACIESWDLEAWKNSLVLTMYESNFDLFPIIYGAAYRSLGSEFINYFAQSILDQPDLPIERKKELIIAFSDMAILYDESDS